MDRVCSLNLDLDAMQVEMINFFNIVIVKTEIHLTSD